MKNGSQSSALHFWFFHLPVQRPAGGSLKQEDASWDKLWLSAIVHSHVKLILMYLERKQGSQGLNLSNMRRHCSPIQNMLLGTPLAGAVVWGRCSPPVCQEILSPYLIDRALGVWQFLAHTETVLLQPVLPQIPAVLLWQAIATV